MGDVAPPLIGVSACVKQVDGMPFHAVSEKYGTAVSDGAGGRPLLIPPIGRDVDLDRLLEGFDGIMLTGSPSNVEPHHYQGPPSRDGVPHDPARDATVLPLIRAAVAAQVPLFAICRGFQEMVVAYGGSLHQHLEEVPGRFDHRRNPQLALADQYAPAHALSLTPGGMLADLLGTDEVAVNSLHGQGVDRLGGALLVEAVAPDATIEAVRVDGAGAFALGVQWHPEFRVRENPVYYALFQAFGAAATRRRQQRENNATAHRVA